MHASGSLTHLTLEFALALLARLTLVSALFVAAPLLAPVASAAETVPEKAVVLKNDAVRATKKGVNRVKEAVCLASDATCLARKIDHRVDEAKDATVDKVDEVKNKIDTK